MRLDTFEKFTIGVVTTAILWGAVASVVWGQAVEPPFHACPPEFAKCFARVKSDSPEADRVCLRPLGTAGYPALTDPLCKAVPADRAEFRIEFPKPTAGGRHARYEVVACDDGLKLCSAPAANRAIAVALDPPTFFDVLRDLASTLGGSL